MCLDLQIVILRNKKSETERQIPYDTTYMRNLKNDTNVLIYKPETDLQT